VAGVSDEVVVGIMADLWHHCEPNTSGTWSFMAAQNTLRKPSVEGDHAAVAQRDAMCVVG
jgi:hypothetical protein